jgi:ribosomal protein S2
MIVVIVSLLYCQGAEGGSSFGIQPIKEGSYVPDLVIFLNPPENLSAIRECTSKNIPTVGIVDTDTDPRLVTYPIPANMEVSLQVPLRCAECQG